MLKALFGQLLGRIRARAASAPDGGEKLPAALAHEAAGRLADAEAIYRELIGRVDPDPEILHLLGNNLRRQGRTEEAVAALERAVQARPESAEALYTLAGAFSALRLHDEAALRYEQVLALRPGFVEAMSNLGNALTQAGRLDEAEDRYRKALELRPGLAAAANNLGRLLFLEGRVREAIAFFKDAFTSDPTFSDAHSDYIYALNFVPPFSPRGVFEAHLEWARVHAEPLQRPTKQDNDPSPGRRLRVGYVSPNFKDHAAAYFFESTLACHDAREIETTCYSDVAQEDETTARIRGLSAHWRPCAGLTDQQLCELIVRDAIDILVDLSGHTEGNRLLAFARKPAPVQVTWNGYANTTGMSAIDYRITDAIADPPGTEALHTEKLVRMPGPYMVFTPPAKSPGVGAPPAASLGHVTFGSFNAVTKITPEVAALWSRILLALPGARLLVAATPSDRARRRIREMFSAQGIDASRLDLRGRLPRQEFLALHNEADIALDPFPFAGTTTTCHSLWMGLPVVTLAGETHVARVGASFLANAGLPEMVASSEDEYVRIAVGLARDLERLIFLRSTLRQRLLDSPLTDASVFTRHLEAAYRRMWQDWCVRNS